MRAWAGGAAALALGVAAAVLSTPTAAGDGTNRMRDLVRQRQELTLLRALGPRADSRKLAPRIIGGNVAPPNKWRFQVALVYSDETDNSDAQFCGGSLIGASHVLTAAHCVDGTSPNSIRILTGTQSLAKGGTRHRAAAISVHPKYRARTQDFDIAVITLRDPAGGIRPVRMLAKSNEAALSAPGTIAYAIGWGDTRAGSGVNYPDELHEVQVPIVATAICNAENSYDGAVTARMICAGLQEGGKDSCQGDSGGPLIVQDANDRWRFQAGIVSWGKGCARANLYGVYARVAVLRTWVASIVSGAGE